MFEWFKVGRHTHTHKDTQKKDFSNLYLGLKGTRQ